jgi:hypothetical protein
MRFIRHGTNLTDISMIAIAITACISIDIDRALDTARLSLNNSVIADKPILFAGFFRIALNIMTKIDAFAR